ncbi:hypothetical protein AYO47_03115 [Planctomyces sp. SCGC AG-212-M04]|nr:hypothetical protein AYO47_03115 [Planctomyces sp. SCGC AG-212-M04]
MSRRTLMSLVALVGLTCAGCGPDVNEGPGSYAATVKVQQSAEEFFKSKGATLTRKHFPPGDAWVVNLSGKEVTDETFQKLEELDHVAELNLSGTAVTDAQMKLINNQEVGGLLVDLDISKTGITDAGLKEFTVARFLMKLSIAGSKITDQGLKAWQADRKANGNIQPQFRNPKITK